MIEISPRAILATIFCLCGLSVAGCGDDLETEYGRSREMSINGSSVLAEMFRSRGDEVRTAYRLTEEVGDWADVIVRFAPHPGGPGRAEGDWYLNWLTEGDGRRLVYIVRDFDVEEEYWNGVIEHFGPDVAATQRDRAQLDRDRARNWVALLPPKVNDPADPDDWFRFEKPVDPPRTCKKLEGPWAEGLAADRAAISIHEPFAPGSENVLLSGDGHRLAIDWPVDDESGVLALANGSFVLNAALVNPSRRELASKVLDWTAPDGVARRVAFVDGGNVASEATDPPTIWDLLMRVASFRWVAFQMGILGLAACLARAPRLGRPLPESTENIDRPSAHAEALGELLARTRSRETADRTLEQYRAWRHGRSGSS